MTLTELPPWAAALLEEARVARLAFLDAHDAPRVLPVTFALADGAIWTAIDRKPKRSRHPARVRYLRRRPHASLLADVYDEDWSRLRWVQVTGAVAVLEEPPAEGLAALVRKYEQYAARAPRGPFMRLAPERVVCWRADEP